MRRLWPDIEVIRNRLHGAGLPELPEEEVSASEHEADVTEQSFPMPTVVAEQIRRIAELPREERAPGVGDVVLVRKEQHAPIAVCLDRQIVRSVDGTRWSGWIVAAETDYATDKDVLLEESDGPSDPLAGMIQTWNPIELLVPEKLRILAHLSDYRMNLIREVAHESMPGGEGSPRPGFVASRQTLSGRIVLTGTPLGTSNDPRCEYQTIFRQHAQAFAVSHPAVESSALPKVGRQQAEDGFWSQLAGWLSGHRLVAGATAAVAVVSGVVVSQMLANAPPATPAQVAAIDPAKQERTPVEPPAPAAATKAEQRPTIPDSPEPAPEPKARTESSAKKSEKTAKEKPLAAPTQLASKPDDVLELRPLLVPLKDQSMVLAMRSGGSEQADMKAYRIRLKRAADIDRAVEFLMSLGFRIIKVEDDAMALKVMISEKQLTPEVEQKLQNTHLFDPAATDKK